MTVLAALGRERCAIAGEGARATKQKIMITDCHVHIAPVEMFNDTALELMKKKRPNWETIVGFCRSPKAFLAYMDQCGIDRAVLINYVAPKVIGFTTEVNEWVANYCKADPKRLIPCGSLHPRHTTNVMADVENIVRLGIRMIKIHPRTSCCFRMSTWERIKSWRLSIGRPRGMGFR